MLTWWYHPSLICILLPRVETIGDAYMVVSPMVVSPLTDMICILLPRVETIGDAYMVVSPLTDMYIITPGRDYR